LAHPEPLAATASVDNPAAGAGHAPSPGPAAPELVVSAAAAAVGPGGLVDMSAIPMPALAAHQLAAQAADGGLHPAQPGASAGSDGQQALAQLAHVLSEALGQGGSVDHLLAAIPDGHGGAATLSIALVDGSPQLILSDANLGMAVNLSEMIANHDAVALTSHV
jgi:hypothetical protein